VSALLRADGTAFVVVTSPRAEAIDESSFLLAGLADGGFPVGGVVVNLVHPMPDELPESRTSASWPTRSMPNRPAPRGAGRPPPRAAGARPRRARELAGFVAAAGAAGARSPSSRCSTPTSTISTG
jgi:anion-transporting  ArsA/GET3 family ATPase